MRAQKRGPGRPKQYSDGKRNKDKIVAWVGTDPIQQQIFNDLKLYAKNTGQDKTKIVFTALRLLLPPLTANNEYTQYVGIPSPARFCE